MRKTDNAIIMLHSVVSHTMQKKGGTESLLVCCALFISASGVCDAVTCDSGHLIIEASVFLFSSFFRIFTNPFGFGHCLLAPPLEKNALCKHCAKRNALSHPMLQLKCVGQLLCEACNRRMPPSLRPRQCPPVRLLHSLQVLAVSPPRRRSPT